jgi:hypothetical protein
VVKQQNNQASSSKIKDQEKIESWLLKSGKADLNFGGLSQFAIIFADRFPENF